MGKETCRSRKGGNLMFYWFYFEDGYSCCTRGFSKQELKIEEMKHGKLLKKEKV